MRHRSPSESVIFFKTHLSESVPDHEKGNRSLYREVFPPILSKSPPKTVDLVDDIASVITKTSTDETKTMKRNEKVILFTSLLFSISEFDRNGTILSLSPGEISVEALDILSSLTSTSEQARCLHDSFAILADDVSKEKDYVSNAAESLFVSQTSYTYMIQCYYHTGPIDKSGDSIKKTFNFLNLLPPPKMHDDEYDRHINSSRNAPRNGLPSARMFSSRAGKAP